MQRTTRATPIRRFIAALATTILAATMLTVVGPSAHAASPSDPATAKAASFNWPPPGMICDPGLYRINTGAGMVLDVSQSSVNHAQIIQWPWQDSWNQKWFVCHTDLGAGPDSLYSFRTAEGVGPWCMSIDRGHMDEGRWNISEDCNNLLNQQFWLSKDPATGWFAMQAQHSKMWVALSDSTAIGAGTAQYRTRADLFQIQPVR